MYTSAMFLNYIKIFFISMVPLLELRGAIPISQALDMPVIPSYIISIIGNIIPVPFIYLFARKIIEWGKDKIFVGKFCTLILNKGSSAQKKIKTKANHGLFIALVLFVAIPVPGTGAWTGAFAASLLGINLKNTLFAVSFGITIAGIIMMLASFGFFSAAEIFFSK